MPYVITAPYNTTNCYVFPGRREAEGRICVFKCSNTTSGVMPVLTGGAFRNNQRRFGKLPESCSEVTKGALGCYQSRAQELLEEHSGTHKCSRYLWTPADRTHTKQRPASCHVCTYLTALADPANKQGRGQNLPIR